MRRFFNIKNKERQEALATQFKDLNRWGEDEQFESYKAISLTVFDHWLSEEEANIQISPDIPKKERQRRDDAFLCFRELLFKNTEVLTYRTKGRDKRSHLSFKAFTSLESGLAYSTPTIMRAGFYLAGGRVKFFQLVLPQLDAIYLESWDDTNILLYKNNSTLELVKQLAKESGLFCL